MAGLTARQAVALYTTRNPFDSPAALRASNYSAVACGNLVRLLDWREPLPQAKLADRALRGFLGGTSFSCVAGKAVVNAGAYRFGYYLGFGDRRSTEGLARDLAAFVAERSSMKAPYSSFIAVFEETAGGDERWFEAALWRQLEGLAELGSRHYSWNREVGADPHETNFAFSFAGEAFFVVGLHPQSSRLSRRFFLPTLAFNAHAQFRHARKSGAFQRITSIVRERELVLQGSINPELREFGTRSEARQYSGRATEENWQCPFRVNS